MKQLLNKEFRLAMHPTSYIFILLSAMILIPNYPYYVIFFYTCLGIFFTCLTGRENNDIIYSLHLPIRKRDIVSSRILSSAILQLLQLVFILPFLAIRSLYPNPANLAGMDANFAFLGLSLVMLGLFNLAFFTGYYRNPNRVGRSFVIGSVVTFVYILIVETAVHIVPVMQLYLDNSTAAYLPYRLAVLALGLICYAVLTWFAWVRATESFTKLDL